MAKLKPEPAPIRPRSTRIRQLDVKKKRGEATKGKSDAGVKKKTTAAAAKKKTTATAKKVKDAVVKKDPAVKKAAGKAAAAAKPAAKKTAAAAKPKAKSAAKEVKKAATTKKAAPKKTVTAKTTKKTIAKKPAPKKATASSRTTTSAAKETVVPHSRRPRGGRLTPFRGGRATTIRGRGGRLATAPQHTDDFAAIEQAVRDAYIPSPVKPTAGRGKKPAADPPSASSSDDDDGSDSSSNDISIPIADIFRRAYIAGGVPLVRQTYEQQNVGLAKIFEHDRAQRQAGKKGPNLSKEPNHVDHEHRHAWYLGGPGLVALLDSNPKKARADIKAIGKIVPRLRSRETGLHRLAEELGGSRLHFLLSYTPADALRRIEEELVERDAGKKKKASPAKSGGRTALHRRAFNLGGATLERLLDHADAREGVIEYIEFLEGHPAEQVRVHAANKEEDDRQERGDLERRARALGIHNDLRNLIYEDMDEARRRVEEMEAKAQGKGKGKGKTPSPAKPTRRSASPVKSTRRSASPAKKKVKTPSPAKSGVQKRAPSTTTTTTLPTDLYRRAHHLGGPALQALFVQNPAAAVPQIQKLTKTHNRNPKPSTFPPPTTTQRSPLEQGAFSVGGESFIRFMYDDPYAAMHRLREIVEGRGVPETHRVRTHANSLLERMEQEAAEAGLEVDEYMWGGPR